MTLISPQKAKFAWGPLLLIGLNMFIVVLPKTHRLCLKLLSARIDFNSLQAITMVFLKKLIHFSMSWLQHP